MLVGGVQFFSQVAPEVRAGDRHQILNGHESNALVKEYLTTGNQRKSFFERHLDIVGCLHVLGVLLVLVEANTALEFLPEGVTLTKRLVLNA